jgi:uncharacterized protein (DUF302 family)
MSVYLIGNPVLTNRMYEAEAAVGLYAPHRASIYEGKRYFTYERPSGLLEHFKNEEIRVVGRMLDRKMESLSDHLAR